MINSFKLKNWSSRIYDLDYYYYSKIGSLLIDWCVYTVKLAPNEHFLMQTHPTKIKQHNKNNKIKIWREKNNQNNSKLSISLDSFVRVLLLLFVPCIFVKVKTQMLIIRTIIYEFWFFFLQVPLYGTWVNEFSHSVMVFKEKQQKRCCFPHTEPWCLLRMSRIRNDTTWNEFHLNKVLLNVSLVFGFC